MALIRPDLLVLTILRDDVGRAKNIQHFGLSGPADLQMERDVAGR
jgi:hypothetical protein